EGTSVPWTIGTLDARLGELVVTFNGVDRLKLPITFQTSARNVALGDLATLRLAADLEVPPQPYRFPGLDLELTDMRGSLHFHYPPGEGRDNVVNVLEVAAIRWHGIRVTDGWLSLTFDQKGINGGLGGAAYAGYVNGGLSVPFSSGPSSGWFSGSHLDLGAFSATAGGGHVAMVGTASFEATAAARGSRLDVAAGRLALTPGPLDFPHLSPP